VTDQFGFWYSGNMSTMRPTRIVSMILKLVVTSLCFASAIKADSVEPISLTLPMACELGVTCFVQNYVDHDSSNTARDYECGGRTYDGHDGTDIRIPNLEIQRKGVAVLAAASGRVARMRDGVDDISVRTIGKAAVIGKECGNGAVIEHQNGWQTQYCHLAKGSLRVKAGDRVAEGLPIGLVGLSGDTEFPHLHFTVRHRAEVIDPFAYGALPSSCGSGRSIWAASIREQTKYHAGEILNYGFADVSPTMELIESGETEKRSIDSGSKAIVAYVRTIGLQAGDEQILTVQAPDGAAISEYRPPALDHDKAQSFISAGKRRGEAIWSAGTYTASYRVIRDGGNVLSREFNISVGAK
jgi:Peptidase family M23